MIRMKKIALVSAILLLAAGAGFLYFYGSRTTSVSLTPAPAPSAAPSGAATPSAPPSSSSVPTPSAAPSVGPTPAELSSPSAAPASPERRAIAREGKPAARRVRAAKPQAQPTYPAGAGSGRAVGPKQPAADRPAADHTALGVPSPPESSSPGAGADSER